MLNILFISTFFSLLSAKYLLIDLTNEHQEKHQSIKSPKVIQSHDYDYQSDYFTIEKILRKMAKNKKIKRKPEHDSWGKIKITKNIIVWGKPGIIEVKVCGGEIRAGLSSRLCQKEICGLGNNLKCTNTLLKDQNTLLKDKNAS